MFSSFPSSRAARPQLWGNEPVTEEAMLDDELKLFASTMGDAMERTKKILALLEMNVYTGELSNDLPYSVQEVYVRLGGEGSLPGKIFTALFREEEWLELRQSEAALSHRDADRLRVMRAQRQLRLLAAAREVAVDTVNGNVVSELKALMKEIIDRIALKDRDRGILDEEEDDEGEEREVADVRRSTRHMVPTGGDGEMQEVEDEDEDALSVGSAKRLLARRRSSSTVNKKKTKKSKNRSSGIMDISEDEVDDADDVNGEEESVKDLLQRMRLDEAEVMRTKDLNGSKLVVDLVVPDPLRARAECGAVIVSEKDKLLEYLSSDERLIPIERVGKLTSLWCLGKRAFAIRSILQYLRSQKGKGKTLLQRYDQLVVTLKLENCFCYQQACRYDKLGKFLEKYPRFLYQLQLTTLKDWTGCLKKNRLEKELDDPKFWQAIPQFGCNICGVAESEGDSWTCNECGKCFHECCERYVEGSLSKQVHLSNGQLLDLVVYCAGCLDDLNISREDVMNSIREARSVSAFLVNPYCEYDLIQIPRGDAFVINVLMEFATSMLGYTGDGEAFCGALANATLDYLRTVPVELVKPCVVKALRKVAKARKRVQLIQDGHLKEVDLDFLFHGFTRMFVDSCVNVYVADEIGHVSCGPSSRYGEGENALCLMHWTRRRHYDLLVLKATS